MTENEELQLEVEELDAALVLALAEAREARDLARALWAALTEATEDRGEIARIDPDLDVDERLPCWLTGVYGAPETWQRVETGDSDA